MMMLPCTTIDLVQLNVANCCIVIEIEMVWDQDKMKLFFHDPGEEREMNI